MLLDPMLDTNISDIELIKKSVIKLLKKQIHSSKCDSYTSKWTLIRRRWFW